MYFSGLLLSTRDRCLCPWLGGPPAAASEAPLSLTNGFHHPWCHLNLRVQLAWRLPSGVRHSAHHSAHCWAPVCLVTGRKASRQRRGLRGCAGAGRGADRLSRPRTQGGTRCTAGVKAQPQTSAFPQIWPREVSANFPRIPRLASFASWKAPVIPIPGPGEPYFGPAWRSHSLRGCQGER